MKPAKVEQKQNFGRAGGQRRISPKIIQKQNAVNSNDYDANDQAPEENQGMANQDAGDVC